MIERLLPAVGLLSHFSQELYRDASATLIRRMGVRIIGRPLWISPRTFFDLSGPGCISIGDETVISHYVKILTHDYSLDRVARRRGITNDSNQLFRQANVTIGAYVFIGMDSLIMPGVTIGDGAIIGAGSVVTRDVEADTVVAGNPARPLASTDEILAKNESKFELIARRP